MVDMLALLHSGQWSAISIVFWFRMPRAESFFRVFSVLAGSLFRRASISG